MDEPRTLTPYEVINDKTHFSGLDQAPHIERVEEKLPPTAGGQVDVAPYAQKPPNGESFLTQEDIEQAETIVIKNDMPVGETLPTIQDSVGTPTLVAAVGAAAHPKGPAPD